MYTLGICGGVQFDTEERVNFTTTFFHDSAAVLLKDGVIVAGIEEERLNRIKHTDSFPVNAIEFCLRTANISINDIDKVAYFHLEQDVDLWLSQDSIRSRRSDSFLGIRETISQAFKAKLKREIKDILHFVSHHDAHAASAHCLSGFEESLTLVIDGQGGQHAISVYLANGNNLEQLKTYPMSQSLGVFYWMIIATIGYNLFDEYKVMGLAPYGDPAVLRSVFESCYELNPKGEFQIDIISLQMQLHGMLATKSQEQQAEFVKHVAAALQETLEKIVLHILEYFKSITGVTKLSMAGGVAHNCSMNGKIIYKELFEEVFIQPAAHDAGGSIGSRNFC